MALDFPNSPSPGTIFEGGGGSWVWDGVKWRGALNAVPPGNADYDTLVWLGGEWTNQRPRYVVSCCVPGLLHPDQNLLYHRFAVGVTFPANAGSYLLWTSKISCGTAPTADTTLAIARAPSASLGTFADVASATIYGGGLFGAFSTVGSAPVIFSDGDVMRIRAPNPADATLADVFLTIVGYET